ncbi:MATE family efflux transporter [Photobacterium sp. ZSDE20]|uniref:MATE family efflux transporter n=1 Tax=Photobacterium pectinilyticum TaxID=2906793 RepID=A0ABT1N8G9_9GAMM|nr:MATE family efflux transporter [Photobacterium sp. ZSDE20]MCQ1061042.1 MATE family efflux transporter [Photobacterium sp. ZSDE20]MDD1829090.1 MATE family efflux transporter [Photobacterium sp. ZSDE20]
MALTNKDYYKIAIPFIISTVTQPLLGAVDTAVIGRLGIAELIGGVAIGTVIMNTLYWLFGFFRVSTTGQSAIAMGKNCDEAKASSLLRPFILSGCVGGLFILTQSIIWQGALWVIEPAADVAIHAKTYFDILIFGAPLVLLNYTVIGWLMGQAKVKEVLFTQVFGNVLNIILDAIFVLWFDFGVAGVAFASLIVQATTFAIGMVLVTRSSNLALTKYLGQARMTKADLRTIISSNTDLMLRTVCILIFFNMMARTGSRLGADVLATNAILMQVTFIVSYMFDGIANASSVFSGKAVGEKSPGLLKDVLRLNFQWTTLFVIILTVFIALFKNDLVFLFTDIPSIISLFEDMSVWLLLFPFVAGYGLTVYGIFTGTGTTRPVRDSSIVTLLVFLMLSSMSVEAMGNHGLWLAFTVFYIGRFLFLYPFIFQVKQKCL